MLNRTGLRLFRAAAYVLVGLALVHSLSLFVEPAPSDGTEAQLVNLMKTYTSEVMGSERTYWQFLYGFSASFAVLCLAAGGLSLMVSRALDWVVLRRIALFNASWLAVMTCISLRYFFAAPTAFLGVSATLFGLAWWRIGRI